MTLPSVSRAKLRTLALVAVLVLGVSAAIPVLWIGDAVGQEHTEGGGFTIQDERERSLFFSLICMCGCPRETLGTCACGYADQRRSELREMLADGKTPDDIREAYAKRFGPQAVGVPPNAGAHRLVWAAPLVGLVVAAGAVVFMLRRWRARGAGPPDAPGGGGAKPAARDKYDDQLDAELKELDKE